MSWSNEKSDRSVEAADPDFGCASIEVEGAFFVDLDRDIRSGKDVYADRRGSGKRGRWISEQPTFLSVGKQDDIGNPDLAVASKNSLLDCGEFACVKAVEEIGNSASSLAAIEARGGDMISWPAASISKRSGRSVNAGSVQISSQRLVAGLSARAVMGLRTGTPDKAKKRKPDDRDRQKTTSNRQDYRSRPRLRRHRSRGRVFRRFRAGCWTGKTLRYRFPVRS
jgi:hypothetical protein